MSYNVGDEILLKNPRNPTHWATGKVATITSISERSGRPRYDIRATIRLDCGKNKRIRWVTSTLGNDPNYERIGHSFITKKPIMKWLDSGCHLKFSSRDYIRKL